MDDSAGPRRDGTLGDAEGEARDEARLRLPRAGRADGDADGGMDDASSHGTSCGHTASEQSGNRQDDGVSRPASAWDSFTIIPCRDGKARRIESGTFPLVDGLPRGVVHSSDPSAPINAKATAEARVMRLRGYGNAIVPELAAEFIRAAMEAIG